MLYGGKQGAAPARHHHFLDAVNQPQTPASLLSMLLLQKHTTATSNPAAQKGGGEGELGCMAACSQPKWGGGICTGCGRRMVVCGHLQ